MFDLSIIIPTYKRPELLKRALESIFRQNTDNIQVIVIDDCEEYSGFPVVKNFSVNYYCKSNIQKGLSSSRNIGLNLSLGKYIVFLDDDDFFVDGSLDSFRRQIQKGVDFVFFNHYTLAHGVITSHDLSHITREQLLIGNSIPVGSYLISKSCISSIFDTKISSHEDWNFLLDNILELELRFSPELVVVIEKSFNEVNSHQALTRKRWWLDYLAIYARYPAPELSLARKSRLEQLGLNIPVELLQALKHK